MDSVYILEKGCYLRREGATLKVMKGSDLVDQIPAEGLKRLLLVGYVSLTGGVLDFLIHNRIETVFITPTGRFRARLAIDEHRHVALRKAQYSKLGKEGFALEVGKRIVAGKVNNMTRFLTLRARQYRDQALRVASARLKGFVAGLERARDLDAVRGMEGTASRVYFEVFGRLIRNEAFSFSGRNKRPPRDPVNALLSFVYTLLTNEVLSAIKACGLDPYLGALHEISYGRPSLACDLVEEYRSFLGDRLVLMLLNRRVITPQDFVYRRTKSTNFVDEEEMRAKRPVEMKPAINRAFVAAYEQTMNTRVAYAPLNLKVSYRQLILHQVRSFAAFLEEKTEVYSPFLWER